MRVTVDIERKDLVRLNLYMEFCLRINWITLVAIFALLLLVQLLRTGVPVDVPRFVATIIACALLALVAFAACIALGLVTVLLASSRKSGVLGQHEFEIHPDGLFEKTLANESLSKWSGIRGIITTKSFIYVRINSYLFHVIPRRAFASDADFTGFSATLKARWQESDTSHPERSS